MHSAPSVSYPVGRCRLAGLAAAGLWLAGGGALAAWAAQGAPAGWPLPAGVGAWLASGAGAAVAWLRSPAGELHWGGAGWQFGGRPADAPRPVVDLQGWMLVRARCGRRTSWLWLERNRAPSDWDALRRAVYSRASTARPQRATPPVA